MNIEDARTGLEQSEYNKNENHITIKQSQREPQLRELNINILNAQPKMPCEAVDEVKSKLKAANNSLANLHETENHVNRLLEKLLNERNRILDINPQGEDSKKEVRSVQNKKYDQENFDPKSAGSFRELSGLVNQAKLSNKKQQKQDILKVAQNENLLHNSDDKPSSPNEDTDLPSENQARDAYYGAEFAVENNEGDQPFSAEQSYKDSALPGGENAENQPELPDSGEEIQPEQVKMSEVVREDEANQGELPQQLDRQTDKNEGSISLEVSTQEEPIEESQLEDPRLQNEEIQSEKEQLYSSHNESEEHTEEAVKPLPTRENHDVALEHEELRVTDLLYVNKQNINYGTTLPGQILEETLEIINKSEVDIVVQIVVECSNQEFAASDEYVFAIRRSHSADYNDKHYLLMSPYSAATFKLAVKVPCIKIKDPIRGEITFTVQGLDDKIVTHLEAESVVPRVLSPKELYYADLKCKVVKFAMKYSKKLECKLPIKNHGKLAVGLDFELYQPKDLDTPDRFDCICMPSFINLGPNALGLVNLVLKPNNAVVAEKPHNPFEKQKYLFKKVLIAKCRDSSLIYSFVVLIEVFD